MPNAVLLPILYAGLAGTLLALIVATYQQKWSLRVFFLLALRLAIGWHFLFEGLHKIHTHHVGPSETNRPFSSEPYFKAAQGPLGPFMRRQFDDPMTTAREKLTGTNALTRDAAAKLAPELQETLCPLAVAKEFEELFEEQEEAELKGLTAAEEKLLKDAKTDEDRAGAKEKFDKARDEVAKRYANLKETAPKRIASAKRKFALWVYGVEGRDAKLKGIANDVPMTAPQRLAHIETLRMLVQEEDDRLKADLGNGFGIEQKKASELRNDLIAAEIDLNRDLNAFVTELKKEMLGGKAPEEAAPVPSRGQRMDKFTMWFLVVVGAFLLGGLFTRAACIAGVGFLALTYLTHPPFPWYPLPPNTEGNPVFINKNAIEALALLVLATFPTGRWLGLDALIGHLCGCGRNSETT